MKISKNQIRSFELSAPTINDDGLYHITFSSETPGMRPYGNEIVKHDKGSINLEYASKGLSLLFNHDMDKLIGKAENIRIDPLTKQGMADIRFFSTPDAQNIEQKVKEGAGFVSYRYSIDDYEIVKSDKKDEPPTVYITKSTPKEISIVSVPFDFTVGIQRSDDEQIEITIDEAKATDNMEVEIEESISECDSDCVCSCGSSTKCGKKCDCGNTTKCADCADKHKTTDKELITKETKTSDFDSIDLSQTTELKTDTKQTIFIKENKNMSNERNEILALGTFAEKMGVVGEFKDLANSDKTTEEIRSALVDVINAKNVPLSTADVNTDDSKEIGKHYSIARAFNAQITGDWSKAGFEKEVQELKARSQMNYAGGLILPHEAIKAGNAMNTTTTNQGKEFVLPTYAGFVEMLRPTCLAISNGANVIGGLSMNYQYVQETAAPATYWVGENSGTDVTPVIDTLQTKVLSPKQLMAQIQYTRSMMVQSPVAFDQFVSARLLREFGIAIDVAAFGAYVSGGVITAPTNGPSGGILLDGSVPTVAINTNGGNISTNVAKVLALKTQLNTNNALNGFNPAFFTTPGIQGVLESTVPPGLTYASSAYWTNNTLSGYKAVSTANLPTTIAKGASGNICHAVIMGDMSQLSLGVFGDIVLTLDPYTLLGQGAVRVVANQLLDVGLTRPTAFAKIVDAIAL